MSVRISYSGNIGNSFFQYVYARLLAERNGFYLQTPFPYQKLLQTTLPLMGKNYSQPKVVIEEPLIYEDKYNNGPDKNDIEKRYEFYRLLEQKLDPGQYVLKGFFEYSELFNPHEKLIKSFFVIDDFKKNTKDIVMNIRLGDFAGLGRIIDSDWYLKILEQENFDKLYIVGANIDEPYLIPFMQYEPVIVRTDPINDFYFIMKFDKIICSNSTYCWWAAFLSEATTIYVSDKWISPLLTSCRNSVMVKAEYLKSYTPSFYYSPVQKLVNPGEQIKLTLDNTIAPSRLQIKQFIADNIKIIYHSVSNSKDIQPQVLQLNIYGVCSYAMRFYKGGSWLSEGSALLADCRINFADWKSFYDWVFDGLRDIINPYLSIKGNHVNLTSSFDLPAQEGDFADIFNDFTKRSAFLKYREVAMITEETIALIEQGAVITWFDEGQLYLCCAENSSINETESGEFYRLTEIALSGQLTNQFAAVIERLALKGLKTRLYNIGYKKTTPRPVTFEDAVRLFNLTNADHLISQRFIVEKR